MPTLMLTLTPLRDVRADGGGWFATGPAPCFAVVPPVGGELPFGWVRVRCAAVQGVERGRLQADAGGGPSVATERTLSIDSDRIDAVLLLPEVVTSLSLSLELPRGMVSFSLGALQVTSLGKVAAMVRGVVPMLRRPRAFTRIVRGLGAAARTAGAAGLRATLREAILQRDLLDYPAWLARHDRVTAGDRDAIIAHAASWPRRPTVSVVMPEVGERHAAAEATRASLEAQLYRPLEVVAQEEQARGETLCFVEAGDVLAPHALYLLAHALLATPSPAWVYGDHDVLDARGQRTLPSFKPAWNPLLLQSQDYIGEACLYATAAYRALGPVRSRHEARLRLGAAQAPAHVPFVVLHQRPGLPLPTARPCPPLPAPLPLVSLIIPTRDRVDLLHRCVESIFAHTTYRPFELLVVDNGSQDAVTLRYLRELETRENVRVLRDERPFNFGALNNGAAAQARGELLALVNNDIEVRSPDWLEELVRHALQPGTGAVGCKLLFPDGRIQHAGVVLGIGGVAGHIHKFLHGDGPGYQGRAQLTQHLSAVTAACLVVRRALYLEVGGIEEEHLPVGFNDVDFCLRLLAAGYRNVYTPHAVLLHHESPSRGHDDTPEKQARARSEHAYMQRRWGARLAADPAFSPNLALCAESTVFASPPRVTRPWLAASDGGASQEPVAK